MLTDDFLQIAELLRDQLILVDSERHILALNRSARTFAASQGLSIPSKLENLFDTDADGLNRFLRNCARSRDPVLTTVGFIESEDRFRCHGSLVEPRVGSTPAKLLLTLIPQEASNQPFAILNEQLERLAREIDLRRKTEASLQAHLKLSEFGREFGLVLSRTGEIDAMLSQCTDLMVEHLDAAFARIWVVDDKGEALILRASSGLYTHLDGSHSRIQIGEFKIGYIAESQKSHLSNDVLTDPRINQRDWARREGMVAFAGYPLVVDDATVGVMAMFAQHELSDNVITAMGSVANELALGISRKQAETALREKAQALEIADIRKNEFLAMLAHELRNPLAPIRSGLELLTSDLPGNELVEIMRRQVDHIVRIVDDLLDVSRIMRGRIEMRKGPVMVRDIIERSLATVRPAIDAADHSLNISQIHDSWWVDGDEVRLSQVFTNLLNNSVKYTPPGGKLSIDAAKDGQYVAIRVLDNGIGIDPDFAPELFTLFAQSPRSLDRSQGGLGIGLTLVKQIVQMHGGMIEATSEGLGQGSQFTVRLPLCKTPQNAVEAPTCDLPIQGKSFRVLIVDDNVPSAKLLARLIERNWSHEIEVVHDGEAAISAAESFSQISCFSTLVCQGWTDSKSQKRCVESLRLQLPSSWL